MIVKLISLGKIRVLNKGTKCSDINITPVMDENTCINAVPVIKKISGLPKVLLDNKIPLGLE